MRLHVSACINIVYMHYECLFYAFVWMFIYDVYEFNVKLKSNPLRNLCFQELLKLNLCMFTTFIIKLKWLGWWRWHCVCLVTILLRNLVFLTPTFPCRLQRMSTSGTVVFFIEFPVWHWRFDPVLNASVMSMSAALRVYIFHDRSFQVPVTSSFFHPHQPYDEVTLDDIRPYFSPPRYPTTEESNLDTHLTPTISLDFDPSEPSYLSYHVKTDPSEPSCPSVIRMTSNSSSSSAASRHVPPPVCGRGFIRTHAVPRGCGRARGGGCGDVTLEGFGNGFLLPDEWRVIAWGAEHEDSPFLVVVIRLSFYCMACLGDRDFWCIFLYDVFSQVSFVRPTIDIGPAIIFMYDF